MKKTIFYILFVFTLFAASCEREVILPGGNEPAHPEGTVPVYINMEVGDVSFVGEEPLTKAATDAEKKIQDFWVLQFNGALSSSTLVAAQLISYNSENLDENVLFLYPSEGATHRIVILTNQPTGTNNLFTTGMTYDNLLSRSYSTETMRAYISNNGGIIPMSGYTDAVITAKMTLSCTVTRNVAKVTFNLSKTTSDYSLDSLFICNVPSQSYLYPHGRTGVFPTADADRININLGSLASISSTATEFTFYIPVNQAGTSASSTSANRRRAYAPIPATFLTVRGQKTIDGAPALIYYHKYIGTNETTNFNVLPNNTYTYNYRITGSNIGTNTNIEKSEINNCYIAPKSSSSQTITIDVAEMVNRYWKKELYKVHPSDTDLEMETLWSEGEADGETTNASLSSYPLSFSRTAATTKYVITIPANAVGNYVVAIKKGGVVRWSYHIWCPETDPTITTMPLPNTSSSSKIVMRLNLGATFDIIGNWDFFESISPTIRRRNWGLYYQWGRKDPFKESGTLSSIVSNQQTIEYSILNPEKYISSSNNWTSSTETLWTAGKTMYDPCPKGWRVISRSTWSGVTTRGSYFLWFLINGRVIYYNTSNQNYFGPAGYRNESGDLTATGTNIFGWTCDAYDQNKSYGVFSSYSNEASVSNSYNKVCAMPLRCQKIE
jgi:hypothetical protein